jgi:multidrug resistance efflux pump
MKKEAKEKYKNAVSLIDDEYKYTVKGLDDDYKDEYRDYKKLRSLSGSTEDEKLQEAYKKYLVEQAEKDLQKAEKQVEKQKKQLEKIDAKLDKLYEQTGNSSIYKGEPYVPTDEESLDELNDEPQEKVE